MLPGFLVLLAAVAGLRLTARRWALVAVSGLVLVTVFALINYFVAGTGHRTSATSWDRCCTAAPGPRCCRKMTANLGPLTANPFVLVIPVVVIAAGAVVARPARFGAGPLAGACRASRCSRR